MTLSEADFEEGSAGGRRGGGRLSNSGGRGVGAGVDHEHYSGIDAAATDEGEDGEEEEEVVEGGGGRGGSGGAGRVHTGTASEGAAALTMAEGAEGKRITWSDEHGYALVEIFYSDRLHYSVPIDDGTQPACCTVS